MIEQVFNLTFTSVGDCFIYLPHYWLHKLDVESSDPQVMKLTQDGTHKAFYLTCSPQSLGGPDENSVGISAAYANLLGLNEGPVYLSSCNQIPAVKTVHASAATEDDYEIMEMSQSELELSMLDQVQVVSVDQPVVVWLSKTIRCNVVIGKLDPSVAVGRLAKFTDIVVEPFVSNKEIIDNEDNRVINGYGSVNDIYSNGSDIGSVPITDDNKSDNTDGDASTGSSHSTNPKKNKHSGLFRVVVIQTDSSLCCESLHDSIKNPYNVFVNKDIASWWQRKLVEERYASVCRLKPVTSTFTKATLSLDLTPNVYVRLYPIEENCETIPTVKNGSNWRHQPLFISETVRSLLKLRTGAKVKLELFTPSLDKKLNEVELISPPDLDTDDVEKWFREGLLTDGNVLINGGGPMPMLSSAGRLENIMVTLHPASIPCWPFSSAELQTCQLTVIQSPNKIGPNSNVEIEEKSKIEHVHHPSEAYELLDPHSSSTLETILKDGITAFEVALGLVDVPWLLDQAQLMLNNNVLAVGSGNNALANWLCDYLSGPPYYLFISTIDCKTLKGKKVDTIQKLLLEELENCVYYQPSVVVLLEIDAIAGVPTNQEEKTEKTFLQCMSRMIRETFSETQLCHSVGLLATSRSSATVSSELVGPWCQNFFPTILEIPPLTKDDRVNMLKEMINKKMKTNISVDLQSVGARTESYVFQDLLQIVDKTCFRAWQRKVKDGGKTKLSITTEDLEYALQSTSPAHLKSINLFKSSKHTWNSIGGMNQLKETLTELIIWPSKYREIYEQCPLRSENGVLLYGAPGTGKTLLASALAGECNLNFISIKGPELLSKYIGASEENVRNVFDRAQKAKPCILFFDEFDSLAPRRGHDNSGVSDRVVNQLLTQMDGVEERTGVWVLAASSRPDLLDPALLRPGRIGHALYCNLPTKDERFEILNVLVKNLPLSSKCDLISVAQKSENFTGADLQALLYAAQMAAYDELTVNKSRGDEELQEDFTNDFEVKQELVDQLKIENHHMMSALENAKPSLNHRELERYQRVYEHFKKSRSKTNKDEHLPEFLPQKVTLA